VTLCHAAAAAADTGGGSGLAQGPRAGAFGKAAALAYALLVAPHQGRRCADARRAGLPGFPTSSTLMAEYASTARVRLVSTLRLQWQRGQDTHFLITPEGAVQLNRNAALILGLCDGSRSAGDITRELARRQGGEGLTDDAQEFLDVARGHGWIVED
jgi:pyrroloquinoline quinone biosynthesis protein D